MTFRDHADAMRVIGATFDGHALFEQPCQSWMVRRVMVPETGEPLPPASADIISSSAYHFVVTWIPGRALIITGDIGSVMYTGITHLASLEETVRLVREADFDYLARKSSHQKEYDAATTMRELVARAYDSKRTYGDDADLRAIVDWADHVYVDDGGPLDRKAACRALLDADLSEHEVWEHFSDLKPTLCTSWPSQAHWHYEALRTWGHLMARQMGEAKMRAAREAAAATPQRAEAT